MCCPRCDLNVDCRLVHSHVDSEPSTIPMRLSAELAEVVADYQHASLNSTDLEGDDHIHKNWDSARSDMLKEDASLKANESVENTLPSFSVFEAYSQRKSLDSDQNDDLARTPKRHGI